MKPSDFSDQTKIFNPETWSWPVHLIGAGGINNLVGLVLAKMGISEIHIWDDDRLEDRNLPTEIGYSTTMCGEFKADAMADLIYHIMPNGVNLHKHYTRVTEHTELEGVVISGVDSMASREVIWTCIQENYLDIPFYIDGRSGGEEFQLFAFSPVDFSARDDYESWLFHDHEAAELPCGARNIGYIAASIAGEIGHLITMFHRGITIEDFPVVRNFKIK